MHSKSGLTKGNFSTSPCYTVGMQIAHGHSRAHYTDISAHYSGQDILISIFRLTSTNVLPRICRQS